jgi:hypothetical protein
VLCDCRQPLVSLELATEDLKKRAKEVIAGLHIPILVSTLPTLAHWNYCNDFDCYLEKNVREAVPVSGARATSGTPGKMS